MTGSARSAAANATCHECVGRGWLPGWKCPLSAAKWRLANATSNRCIRGPFSNAPCASATPTAMVIRLYSADGIVYPVGPQREELVFLQLGSRGKKVLVLAEATEP
jgi:hypothetical protein